MKQVPERIGSYSPPPPRQPNRILADKPPHVRVVVAEAVVVQAGFAVKVQLLKAQVLGDGFGLRFDDFAQSVTVGDPGSTWRCFNAFGSAPGFITCCLDQLAAVVARY